MTTEHVPRTTPTSDSYGSHDTQRTVLVAVHTITSLARLLTIIVFLERDERIEVLFTRVPDELGAGVDEALAQMGAKVVPWQEAGRLHADLVLAAALHRIEDLPARRRMAVGHGAAFIKQYPAATRRGFATYGLEEGSLVHEGRVVVDALVLSHTDQLARLQQQCPQAAPNAVEGGDPAYDVLLASASQRENHRRDLRVRSGQTLVVLSSTWGPHSLFGRGCAPLRRIVEELPADYRVVLTLHPAIWAHHGERAVLSWLHDALAAGMDVEDPRSEWAGLLIAADVVLGDPGSIALYAAAIGTPVLLTSDGRHRVDPESVMSELAGIGPLWRPELPLGPQLDAARDAQQDQEAVARQRVSSVPGKSVAILQQTAYQLLELPEPASTPRPEPCGPPGLVDVFDPRNRFLHGAPRQCRAGVRGTGRRRLGGRR
jgi:hypothetical protein